jgi:hypothetical protein
MAKDIRKLLVTKCLMHSDFFDHSNQGSQKCMGDIIRPGRALSHDIMHELR